MSENETFARSPRATRARSRLGFTVRRYRRPRTARVGQRSLSVTADTYTHVLLDDRELDYARLSPGIPDARS